MSTCCTWARCPGTRSLRSGNPTPPSPEDGGVLVRHLEEAPDPGPGDEPLHLAPPRLGEQGVGQTGPTAEPDSHAPVLAGLLQPFPVPVRAELTPRPQSFLDQVPLAGALIHSRPSAQNHRPTLREFPGFGLSSVERHSDSINATLLRTEFHRNLSSGRRIDQPGPIVEEFEVSSPHATHERKFQRRGIFC